MKLNSFLAILLFFVLSSCIKKNNIAFGELSSFEITTPYEPTTRNSGIIHVKKDSTLLYFYNSKTYKQIDVFSLDGKRINTISLKKITDWKTDIDGIEFLNTDSILVLSSHKNIIYLIDKNGNILSAKPIFDVPVKNFKLELSNSYFGSFLQDDRSFLLKCDYYCDKGPNLIENHYRVNKKSPYFAVVSGLFNSDSKITYHLPDFYNRFLKANEANVEMPLYAILNKYTILSSWYNDSLYIYDKYFTLKKAIALKSNYTSIGIRPEKFMSLNQDSLNLNIQTGGIVTKILYDEKKKFYYLILLHEMSKNSTREKLKKNRKWSVLIFDESFNLKDEIRMHNNLSHGEIIMTPKGLLAKQKVTEKNGNYKFTFLKIKND